MAPEAIDATAALIGSEFGKRYLPPISRAVQDQGQERAGSARGDPPDRLSRARPRTVAALSRADQARLYELIWKRAIASQMASAEIERTTADIEVNGRDGKAYGLRATGSVVLFDGFLTVYEEGRDDRYACREGQTTPKTTTAAACPRSPRATRSTRRGDQGRAALHRAAAALLRSHAGQEAGRARHRPALDLRLDAGRAARTATTSGIDKKRLIPEDKGRLVTAFLESFFKRYVEYDFTADLEEKLDQISDGKLDWKDVLRDFWKDFTGAVDEIKDLRVTEVLDALNELLAPHIFPPQGGRLAIRAAARTAATGSLSLKTRQVRRLHRLLELSRMPLHAAARRRRRRRRREAGDAGRQAARQRSRDRARR